MYNQKPTFGANSLIGACIALLISLPIASLIGAYFGSTYNYRVLIYCCILGWNIVGALTIFIRTYKNESSSLSFRFIILWTLSIWLWPLLIMYGQRR